MDTRDSIDKLFGFVNRQGTVVVQAKYDKSNLNARMTADSKSYFKLIRLASMDESVTRIEPNDIVYTVHTSNKLHTHGLTNAAIPVLSHLNGLYAKRKAGEVEDLDDEDLVERLQQTIRPIGIALTPGNMSTNDIRSKQSQLTVAIGGTYTIKNTGNREIRPGDTIMVEIPTTQEILNQSAVGRNTDRSSSAAANAAAERVVLKTVPISIRDDALPARLKHIFQSRTPQVRTVRDKFAESIKKLVCFIMFEYDKHNAGPDAQAHQERFDDFYKSICDMYLDKGLAGQGAGDDDDVMCMGGNGGENFAGEDPRVKFLRSLFDDDKSAALVSRCLDGYERLRLDIEARTLGTAISYGRPGGNFDILLSRN